MSNNNSSSTPQWTEAELRQRLVLLEQVLQERNATIENLQRELRVANSKARITDEVQSENKVLRARLSEMVILRQQQNSSSNKTTTSNENQNSSDSSAPAKSSANSNEQPQQQQSQSKKGESVLDRLRKQLNETGAPSPLANSQFGEYDSNNLPKTEEEEVDEIMEQAMDSIQVETVEERLLRERLEKLTGKK
jgi:hypothetical protein